MCCCGGSATLTNSEHPLAKPSPARATRCRSVPPAPGRSPSRSPQASCRSHPTQAVGCRRLCTPATSLPCPSEGGFANRLSPLIAALGVTAVPNLLIRYQGRLRLTSNELVYLLHVLAHRREGACWPWVAASDVAHRTGAGERSVRDWRASIVKKGYLVLHPRGNTGSPGGGRLSDEHDLSPLFATLEALAL